MVSYNFIDLTDGEWHLLPSGATNVVFEGRNMSENISIEISHDKVVAHALYSVSHNANQDHRAVNQSNGDFLLQFVRATGFATTTDAETGVVTRDYPNQIIRVYYGLSKRAK